LILLSLCCVRTRKDNVIAYPPGCCTGDIVWELLSYRFAPPYNMQLLQQPQSRIPDVRFRSSPPTCLSVSPKLMSSVLGGHAQGQSSQFDKKSYLRYMDNNGRAYRYRAMQIISLCRTFFGASEQDFDFNQDTELRR